MTGDILDTEKDVARVLFGGRGRADEKGLAMEPENKRISFPDDAVEVKELEDQGLDSENVALLWVKGSREDICDLSRKLRTLSLDQEGYKCIFKYAVVAGSDWQKLLQTIPFHQRDAKTLQTRLPNDYLDLLMSHRNENYETCHVFYDLVSEYYPADGYGVAIVKWSNQLREALRKCKVCVCESVSGEST